MNELKTEIPPNSEVITCVYYELHEYLILLLEKCVND